jgi:uncharacterized protein YigA (DUF484 family)
MDRPKDKPPHRKSPPPALPAHSLSTTEVADFLRLNPDFFSEHPDLLDFLTPPKIEHGEGVLDLQHFMLHRQRSEIARLKSQHRSLLALTRANLASQSRIHAAVLALLAATSFEHLIQIITTDLATHLDADVVTIAIEQSGATRPRLSQQGVQILESGAVDAILGTDREVALYAETPGDPTLFGDAAGLVRSVALVRLSVSRLTPDGLLCIGTRRSGKFHAGQGTELLAFLSRALGTTIAAWLDLPA